jgi:hypothetical protein
VAGLYPRSDKTLDRRYLPPSAELSCYRTVKQTALPIGALVLISMDDVRGEGRKADGDADALVTRAHPPDELFDLLRLVLGEPLPFAFPAQQGVE